MDRVALKQGSGKKEPLPEIPTTQGKSGSNLCPIKTRPQVRKNRRCFTKSAGGFNSEVRRSVAEEDLIGSFCVEAFSWASIEF